MKLLVYTRHELIDHPPGPQDPALLLEGSWPTDGPSPARYSLDEVIDGRFDWIDQQAADWAELLAETDPAAGGGATLLDRVSPAWLNALDLRYYLVKLLRPLAYFTEARRLRAGDRVELVAAAPRDEDYAQVLSQLCRFAGVHYRVRWITGGPHRLRGFPRNRSWRRWAGRLSRLLQPVADRRGSPCHVVLCGNPRLLDPVCRELLVRRCNPWWLYDRFALKSWLRWQSTGVGQLVCNSSLGRENRLPRQPLRAEMQRRLDFRGVNLAPPIGRWLARRTATHGPRQTRLIEQIDAHFRQVRPHALVLDEDATPLARAAVAVGRSYGVCSLVVQHGIPCCRFGFAPPAADRILVWGKSSQQQLIGWGVPPERTRITGSPQHGQWPSWPRYERSPAMHGWGGSTAAAPTGGLRREEIRPPRVLLLATVPPRDDRPDAVALHLTGRSYAEMLRTAFAAVAGIHGVELIVKTHPRAPDDPVVRALKAGFPAIRSRVVRSGPLENRLSGVDCVLSCGSSAGVEATLLGLPVIQLAPPGASGFPPHGRWGLAGTAHCEAELRQLLAGVLVEGWQPAPGPDPDVFATFGEPAAARIAEEVLALIDSAPHVPHHKLTPKPPQPLPV